MHPELAADCTQVYPFTGEETFFLGKETPSDSHTFCHLPEFMYALLLPVANISIIFIRE
jgi:hypothetical protein